jgi:GT2 family glycosyltransferase
VQNLQAVAEAISRRLARAGVNQYPQQQCPVALAVHYKGHTGTRTQGDAALGRYALDLRYGAAQS